MKVNKPYLIGAAMAASLMIAHPAIAGQSTATGTASLTVINQCSVTGNSINLGTFLASQTFQDVGVVNGYFDPDENWVEGSRGIGTLNLGSVTCDSGTPYSLRIMGSGTRGSVRVNIGAKNVVASVWVKSIGGQVQVDPFGGNLGAYVSEASWDPAIGVGSGAPQAVLGTIPIGFGILQSLNGGDALPTDQLGAAGTYADTLVYTLNF